MITAAEFVELAESQIGVKENPFGSNKVKYNTWFYGREVSGEDYPWCMAFVQWLFWKCGIDVLRTAGCTTFMHWAEEHGKIVTSNYRRGDIVLYNFDSIPDADHVGVIAEVYEDDVIAVEGNTGLASDANGGCVMKRWRDKSLILKAYRPDFIVTTTEVEQVNIEMPVLTKGVKGVEVKTLQRCLRELKYTDNKGKELKVTAIYDDATITAVKKLQKKRKIDIDGCVGPDTWCELLKGTH